VERFKTRSHSKTKWVFRTCVICVWPMKKNKVRSLGKVLVIQKLHQQFFQACHQDNPAVTAVTGFDCAVGVMSAFSLSVPASA
jgi:hypothetical protein